MIVKNSLRESLLCSPRDGNLWPSLGSLTPDLVSKATELLLPGLHHWMGALRHPDQLLRFVQEVLPRGRALIYGAGTHTVLLLDLLKTHRRDIEVVGIIDRLAPARHAIGNFPVFSPSEIDQNPHDFIIVGHDEHEKEMVASLTQLHLHKEKIYTIYSNPITRQWSKKSISEKVNSIAGLQNTDHIIITGSGDRIIPLSDVMSMFQDGRCRVVYFGRPNYKSATLPENTIDAEGSIDYLHEIIKTSNPKTVYVQYHMKKSYLPTIIRRACPNSTIIAEAYDYAGIWELNNLEQTIGIQRSTVPWLRLFELNSFQCSNLNISKRGGEAWSECMSTTSRPYLTFFPQLTDGVAPKYEPSPDLRLLYAGWLPAPDVATAPDRGYNTLDLFGKVSQHIPATLSVFNSQHVNETDDHLFSSYLEMDKAGMIKYHRRVEYDELLQKMARYDYGWLADSRTGFHTDLIVGVPNRWTGYISGGLPVLLDKRWDWVSKWVQRYNAGLVVDGNDPRSIADALSSQSPAALRAGVEKLRTRLSAENQMVYSAIQDLRDRALAHIKP